MRGPPRTTAGDIMFAIIIIIIIIFYCWGETGRGPNDTTSKRLRFFTIMIILILVSPSLLPLTVGAVAASNPTAVV